MQIDLGLIRLIATTHFTFKAIHTNDTDYIDII